MENDSSLKKVELIMILTSQRRKRDTTGFVGTGLGILNSIDSEVLVNKLSTIMQDLSKVQHPLRLLLLAVGNNQYLVSDVLPQWQGLNEKSLRSIVEAVEATQNSTTLAFSCVQAQL